MAKVELSACTTRFLGRLAGWHAVTLGSFQIENGDVAGRVLSLGNAVLSNASVGAALEPNASRTDLMAGEDLILTSGGTPRGRILVQGKTRVQDLRAEGGLHRLTETNIAEIPALTEQMAATLDALRTKGKKSTKDDAEDDESESGLFIHLKAPASEATVYTLSARQLARASQLAMDGDGNLTTVIRVNGETATWNGILTHIPRPAQSTRLLVYFPEAKNITFAATSLDAMVVAPKASLRIVNARVAGPIIARDITSDSRLEYIPFDGCL
jgi:choice-of-anchor A domain-containing protein